MFDSHCHLDDDAYDADRSEVIARARAAGITGILVPGYEPREWRTLGAFCAQDAMLSCGVGVHPWYVHEIDSSELEAALRDLPEIARTQHAVAIGECGLDNPKARKGGASLELQRRVLARQLEVAKELRLPVILHCVHAHGTLLELLEYMGPLPRGGVMHSFGGAAELVPRYARLGLSFSFAGILSRANAKKPRTSLCAVPRDRLLVESDGPDQALADSPTPRSEPCDILRTLGFMAELRGEPVATLAEAVRANAEALFARA